MATQNNSQEDRQQAYQQHLVSLVEDARKLLAFAAANAKAIESEIRDPLLKTAKSIAAGTQCIEDEQAFFKAYEALTVRTAPVTVDTLEASKTRLPELMSLFSREGRREWNKLTLGRYINVFIFVFVLLATGVTLGYNAVGATGLQKYAELGDSERTADKAAHAGKPEALLRNRIEQEILVTRLWNWSQLPCEKEANFLFSILCSKIDDGTMNPPSSAGEKILAAQAVAARLSGVYLPLLLGWLGAQAYILRKMTREIAENALAHSSSIHHIARVGLGALAGFASVWLLTPEAVGGAIFKTLPAWALAFVAGYGIELVFSFMDRIINAFASKSA
ncbi:hypothetical protein AB4156_35170 [Cupriavidus sp. 2MCAB6]|uniref:hypothetical protein n=1 Tax=Cupriavidus sp. 2MCAB6 TaxID=3232981 RepID=UPI003F8FE26A